jgi:hypothetical protein
MKKSHLKAVLSSLMLLTFIFLAVSGAMLFFGKAGVVLGFARSSLLGAHVRAAILMCALVLTHFILNRRLFFSELKSFKNNGGKAEKLEK